MCKILGVYREGQRLFLEKKSVLTQLFILFFRLYIKETVLSDTISFEIAKILEEFFKNNFNCLTIYIKKPYFCVPKLET